MKCTFNPDMRDLRFFASPVIVAKNSLFSLIYNFYAGNKLNIYIPPDSTPTTSTSNFPST